MQGLAKKTLRLMVECCALYLFSVLLLLLGVYSAMSSPLLGGEGLAGDLPLMSVMLAYDAALLGVLGYLFASPTRRQDGYYVTMAFLLLTLDPTFFTNRVYGYGGPLGLAVNASWLMLAAAKLMVLVGWCRVPLARGTRLSMLAAMAFVYLGPAPLSFVGLVDIPTYLYALAWAPLALAFLAPTTDELDGDPEEACQAAVVRAGELRVVGVLLPFVGVALHLWETASVHGLELGWVHLGPWALALLVLLVRMVPEEGVDLIPAGVLLGAASLFTSLGSTGAFTLEVASQTWTPLRVTLLAHVLVGTYLALRFQGNWLRVYALSAGMLALAGGTPEEICLRFVGPYGWLLAFGCSLDVLRRRREFGPAAVCWLSFTGLVTTLAGAPVSLASAHMLGIGLVALTHVFPEEGERWSASATFATWVLLASAAHRGLPFTEPAWTLLLTLEGGLTLAGAWLHAGPRYRAPVLAVAGLTLWRSPAWAWMLAHRSALGLAGSFLFLAGGFWASAHREELLDALAREDGEAPGADGSRAASDDPADDPAGLGEEAAAASLA